jgi:phosphoribosyl-ATP pyrophosphohydrolase/phosphoribosyl-AMP cyclohydrolase
MSEKKFEFNDLKKNEQGLVPVVVQDFNTKTVLMVAYMNKEAFDLTIEEKVMHYFSRSRNKLWKKGETSSNYQQLIDIFYDCDKDTLLALVLQKGVACHTGRFSCFENYDIIEKNSIFDRLKEVIESRKTEDVENSYTKYLFEKGIDKILKKVGEESAEVIIGAKNSDKNEIIYEVSDLIYHVMVMLSYFEIDNREIEDELIKRFYKNK